MHFRGRHKAIMMTSSPTTTTTTTMSTATRVAMTRGLITMPLFVLSTILLINIAAVIVPGADAALGSDLQVIYAVNAGGYDHTDKHGILYDADPLTVGTASDYGNHLLIIGRISEQDEILYRTERYHTATFGYDLPLEGDGDYALVLKFCEVYFNEPNMKIFDVVLNRRHEIISNLDIFAQVGRGTAHDEYIHFKVSRGKLHYKDEVSDIRNNLVRLEFIKGSYDNPKINAFALFKGDVERIPKLTRLPNENVNVEKEFDEDFEDKILETNTETHQKKKTKPFKKSIEEDKNQVNQQNTRTQHSEQDEDDIPMEEHFDNENEDNNLDYLLQDNRKNSKTSGPRQPNPYTSDESMVLMPVFVAIGCFIPLLFCLCKL